jgi:hypothetical protein
MPDQADIDDALTRLRAEGYTDTANDQQLYGELTRAATCYEAADGPDSPMPRHWPFATAAWAPGDPATNTATAAAFRVMDAERLERAS